MRNISVINRIKWTIGLRHASSVAEVCPEDVPKRSHNRMRGWQIHNYSESVDELQHSENIKKPLIKKPSQLLVKIAASSVNPLDVAMINGYGSTLLNAMRCNSSDIEFPLTLGRDFVGTIVHKGLEIKNSEYKIGDKIWGVVPVHHTGCHCEFIAIDKTFVSKKPENLSAIEASAVLYAGLTAWSGLYLTGQLGGLLSTVCAQGGGRGKKVLVLGGAGGVGSLAIQMLQAEGVEIVATCGPDAVSMIQNLGVTKVVDYTSEESDMVLVGESPYNIILDCAGKGSEYAAALPWVFGSYITFKSPVLKNFDDHGLVTGGFKIARDLVNSNFTALNGNGLVKWGYFMPAPNGIEYLKNLAENRKLLPIIDSVFPYDSLPAAYQKVQDGHLRGKVVVDFSENK